MNKIDLPKRVKKLVAAGKLEQAAKEIISIFDEELLGEKDKNAFHLYNQAIHQVSRLNELKNAQLSGILNEESADRKRNQIRQALLEICDRFSTVGSTKKEGIILNTIKSEIPEKRSKKRLMYIIAALFFGISLSILALLFFKPGDNSIADNPEEPSGVDTTDTTIDSISSFGPESGGSNPPPQKNPVPPRDDEDDENGGPEEPTPPKENPRNLLVLQKEALGLVKSYDYHKINPIHIKSLENKMATSTIDGSNSSTNQLTNGSILLYKTNAGRYGKMEILKYDRKISFRATTYKSDDSDYKTTNSLTIAGGRNCDLDELIISGIDKDFSWKQIDGMTPLGGSKFFVQTKPKPPLARPPFYKDINLNVIQSYSNKMASLHINGSNNSLNNLKKGTNILYKTSSGRFGKMKILNYDSNIKIQATTYNRNGSIYKSTNSLTITANFSYDLDELKKPNTQKPNTQQDFLWEQTTKTERYLKPRNDAIFIIVRKGS